MSLTHINDLHIGVIRSGGTTPLSAWRLRNFALSRFQYLLEQISTDLLINGDLFDTFVVPLHDLTQAYLCLRGWLARNPMRRLILVPGNHDLSKNSQLKSSFQALCDLLLLDYPRQVLLMMQPGVWKDEGMTLHVIPHLPSQELFDAALQNVQPDTDYLFLHCNYDNRFAVQQDHSLNLSPEQAKACPAKRIVIAHEHQRKIALTGKVQIIGNQFPTSIADCQGNAKKYMLHVTKDSIEYIETWLGSEDEIAPYERLDWQDAHLVNEHSAFIRVEGKATAAQAAQAVQAVAKLRASHDAYVITNAVEIESADGSGFEVSLEQIKSFDVLTALLKYLEPDEGAMIQKLLKEQDNG